VAALEQDGRSVRREQRTRRKTRFDRVPLVGGRLRERRRLIPTPEETHA
jgi:hypothetical protein